MDAPTFEPELAQPTPRRIAAREGCALGCGLWSVRLFCMPHTLIGPFLIYKAAKATVLWLGVWLAGVEVAGQVLNKSETPGKKGPYYTIDYAFAVNGGQYGGQMSVDAGRFAEVQVGQPIPVRVWEVAPEEGHRVEGGGIPGGSAGVLWGAALFWNSIIGFIVWKFYYLPYRQRQLVRYGVPTAGIVRDVSVPDIKRPEALTVRYEYAVPAGHRTVGGVFKGSNSGTWQQVDAKLKPGDLITVLYDPNRPRRSLAYRFCDYKAVPPAKVPSLDPQHPDE